MEMIDFSSDEIESDGKYWVFKKNGNMYSKSKFSREQAIEADKSNIGCYHCEDCVNCKDCVKCERLIDSVDCYKCSNACNLTSASYFTGFLSK